MLDLVCLLEIFRNQIKSRRQDSLSLSCSIPQLCTVRPEPQAVDPLLIQFSSEKPNMYLTQPFGGLGSCWHFPPQNSPLGIFNDFSPAFLLLTILLGCLSWPPLQWCCAPSSPHTFPASVLPAMSSLIPCKWPLEKQLKTHPKSMWALCLYPHTTQLLHSPCAAHILSQVGDHWCGPLLGVTVNQLCLSLGFTL